MVTLLTQSKRVGSIFPLIPVSIRLHRQFQLLGHNAVECRWHIGVVFLLFYPYTS